ncbi:MAG: hypothetical protein JWM87_93 [Candidatus Eremiobacteraeota bacterium]|nr:hypothetical protein [Candidatus Eremiobacteraeota bacterium]
MPPPAMVEAVADGGWAQTPADAAAGQAVGAGGGGAWVEDDASRFRLARANRLNTVVTRGLWNEYCERFDSAVTKDTAAFFSGSALSDEQRWSIAGRVDTSIRRIASFTAWYSVGARFFRRGFGAARFAGYATVAALTAAGFLTDGNVVIAVASLLAGVLALTLVERGARTLTRRWPFDAIACIVALGIFTVAFHDVVLLVLTTIVPQSVLSESDVLQILMVRVVFITASGTAVFALTLLCVIVMVHRLYSWVTERRLRLYPEDEIIQSLVAVLRHISAPDPHMVSGAERGPVIDALHWTGCRFENEFLDRFVRGDIATDDWLRETGAQLAAACRLQERIVALAEPRSLERVADYASRTLLRAARGEWSAIEKAPATAPSPKRRLVDSLIDGAKIAFPAVVGVVVYFAAASPMHVVPAAIGENALFTGLLASIVALWSVVDPHSDHGISSMNTIGDMLKTKPK